MRNTQHITWLIALVLLIAACSNPSQQSAVLESPDGLLKLEFHAADDGLQYWLTRNDQLVVDTSALGFELKDQPALGPGMEVQQVEMYGHDETWSTVWGEQQTIRNHFNGLRIWLNETGENPRQLVLEFRLFDDGMGFRYEFPEQKHLSDFVIMNELTEFAMTGDHTAWWIPADYDSYEFLYTESPLSDIDAEKYGYVQNERLDRHVENPHAVNTPVTMKTSEGLYLSLHEANLTDYAGMTVAVSNDYRLQAELVPWADGSKVKATAPAKTPWRTLQIAEQPGDLVTSNLIVNLNEPNKLQDVSWIQPMTYTGIWWEMHIGKSTWALNAADETTFTADMQVEAVHGANTKNAKYYGDFNAEAGIPGLLIEGWNTGWEYWGADTVGFFDFQTPYPDFNLEEVVNYYKEKQVALVGHHETSGDVTNYEKHLEKAFQLYNKHGVQAVKTGYAGHIRPKGEYHHGQWMVRHYRHVVELAAKYKIMVNAHEPIKATGIRRTYPNMMTREGVRGMEYNAWSDGNPPSHTCILPFTRGLSGPTDYTPGIFDVLFDDYKTNERVHTTLAKQLALYVVIYSPMQMAADLPENYRAHPKAFRFIKQVATDWEESHVIDAEIGRHVTIARKERNGDRWFLGSITNEEPRELSYMLDFLPENTTFVAEIYADAPDADWETNPVAYQVNSYLVDATTEMPLQLAAGGGTAIILKPATKADKEALETL